MWSVSLRTTPVVVAMLSALALRPVQCCFAQARAPRAIVVETLSTPGLRARVEVRRDRWGVPHIYAQNQHDLFFAQGFTAAQDRLFQMEMWRRQGEGRLDQARSTAIGSPDCSRIAAAWRVSGRRMVLTPARS